MVDVVPGFMNLLPQFLALFRAQLGRTAAILLGWTGVFLALPALLRRRGVGTHLSRPTLLRFGCNRAERENQRAQA